MALSAREVFLFGNYLISMLPVVVEMVQVPPSVERGTEISPVLVEV